MSYLEWWEAKPGKSRSTYDPLGRTAAELEFLLSAVAPDERMERMVRLRHGGATFKDIGKEVGLSAARVNFLLLRDFERKAYDLSAAWGWRARAQEEWGSTAYRGYDKPAATALECRKRADTRLRGLVEGERVRVASNGRLIAKARTLYSSGGQLGELIRTGYRVLISSTSVSATHPLHPSAKVEYEVGREQPLETYLAALIEALKVAQVVEALDTADRNR
jgi:hypothetical protein